MTGRRRNQISPFEPLRLGLWPKFPVYKKIPEIDFNKDSSQSADQFCLRNSVKGNYNKITYSTDTRRSGIQIAQTTDE